MNKTFNAKRAPRSGKQAAIAVNILVLFLSLPVLKCLAAEEQYFTSFQRVIATSRQDRPILFPLLVDTNNTALKTTNVWCSFDGLKTRTDFGSVRLGMTMEEVVSAWGKPIQVWKWCQGGGPRFNYMGAKVIWEGTNNCARMIYVFEDGLKGIQFENGLTAQSSIGEWLQISGPPARRSKEEIDWLTYDFPQAKVTLTFRSKGRGLSSLLMEKPGGRGFAQ